MRRHGGPPFRVSRFTSREEPGLPALAHRARENERRDELALGQGLDFSQQPTMGCADSAPRSIGDTMVAVRSDRRASGRGPDVPESQTMGCADWAIR